MIQISQKHKIVGVPLRQDLTTIFPHARTANGLILIPHGIEETTVLRNLGFEVPAPVLCHYDWIDGLPFDVQKKTVALLTMNKRAYVLNSMGTGKSKAALWAMDFLQWKGEVKRTLILAPLSTLDFTWMREAFETVPHRKGIVVHHADRKKRLARLDEEADFYVVNHDGIEIIADALKERIDINLMIIDELAVFRNFKADRTKLMRKLAPTFPWAWGMTGAPTPNHPTDVWAQAKILTPERVPNFFKHFQENLMTRVTQYKWAAKPDAAEKAFNALQPAVRFTLEDVTELPELVERIVQVPMGPKQSSVYTTMKAQALAMVLSNVITAANAGTVMNKLLQISIGWVYDSKQQVVPLDNSGRLQALLDTINSTDRKVLVFAPFTHALDGISSYLKGNQIEAASVSGATSHKDRTEIFNLFQRTDKYKVIVAHPGTMAHGLTLTAADTIIWFGPITSLDIFDQANARIRRIGQKHRQQVIMFAGSPVERATYSALRRKQMSQALLLDMFAVNTHEEAELF